jgi:hypothetical protein
MSVPKRVIAAVGSLKLYAHSGTPDLVEIRKKVDDLASLVAGQTVPYPLPDLSEAAFTISFEMFHLRYYVATYNNTPEKRRFRAAFGERIGQAYEYSLLLHLRVLLDFFYRKPKQDQDDVWVGHFEELQGFSTKYPATLYNGPPDSHEVRRHLNKWLAHFTDARWKLRNEHWGMARYAKQWVLLLELIDRFEAALVGEPKQRFDSRMKAFEKNRDHHLHIAAGVTR